MILTSQETSKLLEIMLRNGWAWTESKQESFVQIMKDDFTWYLPKNFMISDLVTAIEHEALNRGIRQGGRTASA